MFATVAVGIGVAGIAIAAIALSRREKVEGKKSLGFKAIVNRMQPTL